jgi:hypothetical protein
MFIASCYTFPFERRPQGFPTRQFVEVRYFAPCPLLFWKLRTLLR